MKSNAADNLPVCSRALTHNTADLNKLKERFALSQVKIVTMVQSICFFSDSFRASSVTNHSVSMPFPSYGANVRGLNIMSDMNYWAKCWILSKSQDFNWAKVFSRTGHLKKFFCNQGHIHNSTDWRNKYKCENAFLHLLFFVRKCVFWVFF